MSIGLGEFVNGSFLPMNGRPPYQISFHDKEAGVTVFAHKLLPHALIEISGRGCENLGEDNLLVLVEVLRPRITRLDLAVDILTTVSPDEFARSRDEGRFKTTSEFKSQTGHTFYIGSRESDRYCRVYRYYEPHPRHEWLRVEFVLKAEQAKAFVPFMGENGVTSSAGSLGNTFGFTHPVWQVRGEGKPPTWRGERGDQKTLFWLNSQVLPVLRRLSEEGALDVLEWLREGGIVTD
jgi:hypothetical protein